MSDQIPTVGRTVLYMMNAYNVQMVVQRRSFSAGHPGELHGNEPAVGDVYPMVIVRTWGSAANSAVNGKVLLDGNDELWVTSVACGESQGCFAWPERV
jgi:hypothetical protein